MEPKKKALCLTFACLMLNLVLQFQLQQQCLVAFIQHLHRQRALLLLQASTLITRIRRRKRRERRLRRIARAKWVVPRPRLSWLDVHFPDHADMPGDVFRRQLRMDKKTFRALLGVLSARLTRQDTSFRSGTPAEKVLAMGIMRLAQGSSYIGIARLMNVGKTTALEAFQDVVEGLYQLRDDYIKLPANSGEMLASMRTFHEFTVLPNVAGALASSRVRTLPTGYNAARFLGPSGRHEIILLAVADGTGQLLHFSAGYPGGLGSSGALHSSTLFQIAPEVLKQPVLEMGEGRVGPYLAAGREFPLTPWLQTPFPDAALEPAKSMFNKEISAATQRAHVAMRLLQSRWGILRNRQDHVDFAIRIATAAAVLHNFCLSVEDTWNEHPEQAANLVLEEEACEVLAGGEHVREILKCLMRPKVKQAPVKQEPASCWSTD